MSANSVPGHMGQMKPTFPAYSASGLTSATISAPASVATISAAPTVKKPESSSGMSIKLMHPDEDISLVSIPSCFDITSIGKKSRWDNKHYFELVHILGFFIILYMGHSLLIHFVPVQHVGIVQMESRSDLKYVMQAGM